VILITESKASEQTCMWILQSIVWFQIIWKKDFVALEFYPLHSYRTAHPPFSSLIRINTQFTVKDMAPGYRMTGVIVLLAAGLNIQHA